MGGSESIMKGSKKRNGNAGGAQSGQKGVLGGAGIHRKKCSARLQGDSSL
jgi:hypothetical protein